MTSTTEKVPRFRTAIQRWVNRHHTTCSELAQRIGIDRSTLSLILSGHRGLSMPIALALHLETGVPVEKLLCKSELHVLRSYLAVAKERAQKVAA